MSRPELPREEVAAALRARRELGDDLEPEVVDAFLDRVGKSIDARVDARLAQRHGRAGGPAPRQSLALPLGSIALGIPVTGAATGMGDGGIVVAIVAWIAIAAVNVVHTRR